MFFLRKYENILKICLNIIEYEPRHEKTCLRTVKATEVCLTIGIFSELESRVIALSM